MYLVNDSSVGTTSGPVLMTFNLDNASIIPTNTVSIVGQMGVSTGVEGIALDEEAGELYVLRSDYLYVVDPASGNLIRTVGQISSYSESVDSGRDLVFDSWGNLYVIDAGDDELYRVDRSTGVILETYGDGNGNSVGYLRGAAWDHLNGRIVLTDSNVDRIYYAPLGNYPTVDNSSIGIHGFTNVEAIGINPGEGLSGGSRVRVLRWREKR
jgi:DNA-binding beta-propeller fold protein YncE